MTPFHSAAHDDAAETPEAASFARRVFETLPVETPPEGLISRIEAAIEAEDRQTVRRVQFVRVAGIAAAGLAIALALPLFSTLQPSPRLSDRQAQQAFSRWDDEYLASVRQYGAPGNLSSVDDPVLTLEEGAATANVVAMDPIAPIVGF